LTEVTGRDTQQGFMSLFRGTMLAIGNPKALKFIKFNERGLGIIVLIII